MSGATRVAPRASGEMLSRAVELHRAGRLAEASTLCRQILAAAPRHAQALHLLGLIARSGRRLDEAERLIRQALAQAPNPTFQLNLGSVLAEQGRFDEALDAFRQAIARRPGFSDAHLNMALLFRRLGRNEEAVAAYRAADAGRPDHGATLLGLGAALYQLERAEEAVPVLVRAVVLQPGSSEAQNCLGLAFRRLGRREEARLAFEAAVALDAGYWLGLGNLGGVLRELGRYDEAAEAFGRALELQPENFDLQYGVAFSLYSAARWEEAIGPLQRALALRPDAAAAHHLGITLRRLSRNEESAAAYRRSLEIDPNQPTVLSNLGHVLRALVQIDEAIGCYRRAIALQPDSAEAHHGLALALKALGRIGEARPEFEAAIALKPDFPDYHNNFGNLLRDLGLLEEGCQAYRRALALRPDYAEAMTNLATSLKDQGKLDEALAEYDRALALKPELSVALGNLVYALPYRSGTTLADMDAAARRWSLVHAEPLRRTWRPFARPAEGPRRPRIGFVSADFNHHPVGYFIIRTLEELRRHGWDFVCYANQTRNDALTERFRACAPAWRVIAGVEDEAVAEQIRADGIDVLFDMSGYMSGNRLQLFTRKPAPVQISWFGYLPTTGIEAIDYLLGDRHHMTYGAEAWCREQIIRLPDSCTCFDPPGDALPVPPLPALANGHVTFGSFNVLCKVTPEVVELWSRILRRVPDSKLLLKTSALSCPATRQRYGDMFVRHGVAPQRLQFHGRTTRRQHMATTATADLALDPFPYSGCTTTVECLWMGVPVLTRPGELFTGRHSLSYLTTIGCTETVVNDLDAYEALAVELARDLPRLAALRADLRPRMLASPLADADRFTRYFEAACQRAWDIWRAGGKPRSFSIPAEQGEAG